METNWAPGIVVLGIGIATAILFVMSARKGAAAAKKSGADDLDERYRSLLGLLKEHAAAKHLLPEAEWAAEQARLEQAAAAVLRERAGAKHEQVKAQARAEKLEKAQAADAGFFAKNPALKGALVGGTVVLFFVVLGVVLTKESTARVDGAGMTGANPSKDNRPPMANRPDPQVEVNRLRERAQNNPDDVDVLADVAGELIKLQQFSEAFPIVTRASGIDPFHVQTRVWRAVLEAVDGDAMAAIAELEHLGLTYDGAYKAYLYAGLVSIETNQHERALKDLETYLAISPPAEQPPFVRMSVAELKAALAQKAPRAPAP